jgi:hypothetical protein
VSLIRISSLDFVFWHTTVSLPKPNSVDCISLALFDRKTKPFHRNCLWRILSMEGRCQRTSDIAVSSEERCQRGRASSEILCVALCRGASIVKYISFLFYVASYILQAMLLKVIFEFKDYWAFGLCQWVDNFQKTH